VPSAVRFDDGCALRAVAREMGVNTKTKTKGPTLAEREAAVRQVRTLMTVSPKIASLATGAGLHEVYAMCRDGRLAHEVAGRRWLIYTSSIRKRMHDDGRTR
jgi:hypothetical protein